MGKNIGITACVPKGTILKSMAAKIEQVTPAFLIWPSLETFYFLTDFFFSFWDFASSCVYNLNHHKYRPMQVLLLYNLSLFFLTATCFSHFDHHQVIYTVITKLSKCTTDHHIVSPDIIHHPVYLLPWIEHRGNPRIQGETQIIFCCKYDTWQNINCFSPLLGTGMRIGWMHEWEMKDITGKRCKEEEEIQIDKDKDIYIYIYIMWRWAVY
jgi:hypothetical protein